jgi:hypothetical protein
MSVEDVGVIVVILLLVFFLCVALGFSIGVAYRTAMWVIRL